jgi:hypothetical protein
MILMGDGQARLLQQQLRVTLCHKAKFSGFFFRSLAGKGEGDGEMPKTCQNFGP